MSAAWDPDDLAKKLEVNLDETGHESPEPSVDDDQMIPEAYARRAVEGIVGDLRDAREMSEGETDELGRGWEKISADAAWKLASIALSKDAPLTIDDAREKFFDEAPTDLGWTRRDLEKKWQAQAGRAVREPWRPRLEPLPALPDDEVCGDSEAPESAPVTSWTAVDIAALVSGLVDGTLEVERPTVGALSLCEGDELALFYRGKTNGIAGPSGSGKTWTALAVAAQELKAGCSVVYLDFEDSAAGIVGRLLHLGLEPEAIVRRFYYVQPETTLGSPEWADLVRVLDDARPSLVVLDSTGEGLAQAGLNPNADEDVALWFAKVPRRIARHDCEPAVLLLDHITKSAAAGESKASPIGSQRKVSAIDGAQYLQEDRVSFSQAKAGEASLKCVKDRPGTYARNERVAKVIVTPRGGGDLEVDLVRVAPATNTGPDGEFRPTGLMEKVSRYLELEPDETERTTGAVKRNVTGKAEYVTLALNALASEGYLATSTGKRNATIYRSVKPYRESEERA